MRQKNVIIAIVAIMLILMTTGAVAYTYFHEEEIGVWTFAVTPGEQHEYWITQEMIDCVGSNKADDLFANIDPPDAQVLVFQQDATGNWRSWVSGSVPGNSLVVVSTNFPIRVSANIGEASSVITIYKCR